MNQNNLNIRILVVDDDPIFLSMTSTLMKDQGFEVFSAPNGQKALEILGNQSVELILSDLSMQPINGLQLLKEVKSRFPDVGFIVISGQGTVETAVEAMKYGADNFVTKPWQKDSQELLVKIEKALENRQAKLERNLFKKELQDQYRLDAIIGKSKEMQKIYFLIQKVADSDATVLILGETGTGKELVARAIHYNSSRKDKPLIVVNCPAYTENLLESELFGHEKGAFTGAEKQRIGRFEMANGGTIFIDEVGDLPASTQAKFLRFLQEKTFERVGGSQTLRADVRIIAATNKNLESEIQNGKFRSDLFFRLNVFPVSLPPLRERKEDIPLLTQHLVEKACQRFGKSIQGLSKKVMESLMAYEWPGNVRELENMMERAVLMEESNVISDIYLPHMKSMEVEVEFDSQQFEKDGFPSYLEFINPTLGKAEKTYFSKLLDYANGKIQAAAEKAGIGRNTLTRKLKELGIDKWDFKE